jgi:hypothetical protein
MPFSPEQLSYGATHAINYFMRNKPIDQVNTERPLLKRLLANRRDWPGGLQYVVENLRVSNDSNFQSYFGDQQVTYNRKRTLAAAKFTWGSFHDGFGLNEDELAQNGVTMTDDRQSTPTDAERVQLVNLFEENMETLKEGFQEHFDIMVHRDGTQSPTDLPGLDHIVDLTPATGIVGTIDAGSEPLWRNYAKTAIPAANLVSEAEIAWREVVRRGSTAPDFILAGAAAYDAYVSNANNTINRQIVVNGRGGTTVDASTTGAFFHGVEIVWDPVFDVLDTLDAPAIPWSKRMYMLNMRHLSLRPIKGHWLVPRKPPRVYDRYVHYFALTAKAALTTNKRSAQAVLAIA